MFKRDDVVKVRGEEVRVIATDFSEPNVLQWGCAVNDPDRDVWFTTDEVEA